MGRFSLENVESELEKARLYVSLCEDKVYLGCGPISEEDRGVLCHLLCDIASALSKADAALKEICREPW